MSASRRPDNPESAPQHSSEAASSTGSGRGGGRAALFVHHTVTAVILVMLLAVGVWSYMTFRQTSFFVTHDDARAKSDLQPFVVQAQLQRIEIALHIAFKIQERYPATLQDLVEMGLLLPSDLYYPLGRAGFEYARNSQGFDLRLKVQEPKDS